MGSKSLEELAEQVRLAHWQEADRIIQAEIKHFSKSEIKKVLYEGEYWESVSERAGLTSWIKEKIAFALISLIVVLGVDEFYSLVKKSKHINPLKFWGLLSNLILVITLCLLAQSSIEIKFILIPILMLFITFLIELYRKKEQPWLHCSAHRCG